MRPAFGRRQAPHRIDRKTVRQQRRERAAFGRDAVDLDIVVEIAADRPVRRARPRRAAEAPLDDAPHRESLGLA